MRDNYVGQQSCPFCGAALAKDRGLPVHTKLLEQIAPHSETKQKQGCFSSLVHQITREAEHPQCSEHFREIEAFCTGNLVMYVNHTDCLEEICATCKLVLHNGHSITEVTLSKKGESLQ